MEILEFIGSILELLSLLGSKDRDESRPLSTEERELAHEGDNKLSQQ